MTLQELQQVFYLEREIEAGIIRLERLRESADVKSPILSDMPKAPGVHDKLGDIVPQIVDQEAELIEHIRQCEEEKERLRTYIRGVPFSKVRLIMTLRFIDQLSWQEVADAVGGKETEQSVKMTVYRYLNNKTAEE